ncbi:hypothetical protein ACWIGI_17525 [Nocardia sp. NPDC055321]
MQIENRTIRTGLAALACAAAFTAAPASAEIPLEPAQPSTVANATADAGSSTGSQMLQSASGVQCWRPSNGATPNTPWAELARYIAGSSGNSNLC